CARGELLQLGRVPIDEAEHSIGLSQHHRTVLSGDRQGRPRARGQAGCNTTARAHRQTDGCPRPEAGQRKWIAQSRARDDETWKSEGFHSWTDAEIARFENRHPIGSRARLALALLLARGLALHESSGSKAACGGGDGEGQSANIE